MKRYLTTIILLIISLSTSANPAAEASALNAFNSVKGSFSTGDAVMNKLQKPLTSDQDMQTLDGSNTFSTQLTCNAEANFLNVTVNPTATNDASILVQIDQDLDATFEYSHIIPNVSGACKNGFVSCDAGTWNNCNYFLLEANPLISTTQLNTELDQSKLYGCYCFNDSCGTNLATVNAGRISETLSTTIALSMANNDPKYIASRLETTSNTTSYYGQDITSCTNDTVGSGRAQTMAHSQRNNDDAFITSEGLNISQAQPADSPYAHAMTQQSYGLLPGTSETNCNITRTLTYNTQPGIHDEEFTTLQVFSQGKNYISCDYSFATGSVSCLTDGTTHIGQLTNTIDPSVMCNSQSNVSIESEGWFIPPTKWGNLDTSVSITHDQAPSCTNNLEGKITIRDHSSGSDAKWFLSREVNFKVSKPSCFLNEVINDGCSVIDQNTCTLYEQKIDGVTTTQGSFTTGLVQQPSVVHVSSNLCSSYETRDWFLKERKYHCQTQPTPLNVDLSHLQDPTINGNTGTITINGKVESFDKPSVTLPQCQQSCEVQSTELDMQTNNDGQASDGRIDNTRYKKVIKQCINNACPLEMGEQVIKPCGCSNDFGEAVMAMQMIRLAGQDIICTSGTLTEQ